jgi:hypothetical protein
LNLRPSGYEPDELPGCSTPRKGAAPARSFGRCAGGLFRDVCDCEEGFGVFWCAIAFGCLSAGWCAIAFGCLSAAWCALALWAACARSVDLRGLKAWRRPTLPRLKTQYHGRRGVSRPSSGWDRVGQPSLWPPGRRSPKKLFFRECAIACRLLERIPRLGVGSGSTLPPFGLLERAPRFLTYPFW